MNLNYTCICLYCGEIYRANRSTSKYCCNNHNSLYHSYGPQINRTVLNCLGVYKDYYEFFSTVYNGHSNGGLWSEYVIIHDLIFKYYYDGPRPSGDEILLVSGYLMRMKIMGERGREHYSLRPFELLTKIEKATCTILKGGHYFVEEVGK